MQADEFKDDCFLSADGNRVSGTAHIAEILLRDSGPRFCVFVMQVNLDEARGNKKAPIGEAEIEYRGKKAVVTIHDMTIVDNYVEFTGAGTVMR